MADNSDNDTNMNNMTYRERHFEQDLKKDGKLVSNMFSAVKETLWPFYTGGESAFNGWFKNGTTMDKLSVLLFSKPWAWLLLVTVVCVFIILIVAACSPSPSVSLQSFRDLTFYLGLIISIFCVGYTIVAVLFWKVKYKYDYNDYMRALGKKLDNSNKVMMGVINGEKRNQDLMNIETSVVSN